MLRGRDALFNELFATQMALSGFGTGCINFYGITEIPSNEVDFDRPVFEATNKDKVICLMLDSVDNVTRWKLLILVFKMVANGLITLHD